MAKSASAPHREVILLATLDDIVSVLPVTRALEGREIAVSRCCFCSADWQQNLEHQARLVPGTHQIVIATPMTTDEAQKMMKVVKGCNPDAIMMIVPMEGSKLSKMDDRTLERDRAFKIPMPHWPSIVPAVVQKFLGGITDLSSLRPTILAAQL